MISLCIVDLTDKYTSTHFAGIKSHVLVISSYDTNVLHLHQSYAVVVGFLIQVLFVIDRYRLVASHMIQFLDSIYMISMIHLL